jgi:hypothetical protein
VNWKGQAAHLLLHLGLPLAGAIAALVALRTPRLDGLPVRRFAALALGAWIATRAGVAILAFGVLGFDGSGDLRRVWVPAAAAVLDGTDPAEHLDNLYGPLFPWTLAAGLGATGRAFAPAAGLAFVAADGVALLLLRRLATRSLGEIPARRFLLAATLAPFTWYLTVVHSQDEAMFSCLLLATLAALEAGRERTAGLVAAAGTWATKALFPFWVLPVLLAAGGGAGRIAARVVAAGALTLAGLLLAVVLGWNALGQVRENLGTRGSTTWFLFVDAAAGVSPAAARAGLAATALACAAAALVALRPRPGEGAPDRAARGVTAVQAAYAVATPFLLSAHLAQGILLVLWFAVRRGATAARPSREAWALAAGVLLWQVPGLAIRAEEWHRHPLLVASWAAFWAWTGWRAWRAPGPAAAQDSP